MAYSRYARQGLGLTDRAQRVFDAVKRSKVSGVQRVYADREAMLFGNNQFKGLYQIPGASGLHVYTPKFQAAYAAAGSQERASMLASLPKIGAQAGSQFGVHTAGYSPGGRGYPPWVMQMLGKGTELGKPPGESGGMGSLLGLATVGYVLLKVI